MTRIDTSDMHTPPPVSNTTEKVIRSDRRDLYKENANLHSRIFKHDPDWLLWLERKSSPTAYAIEFINGSAGASKIVSNKFDLEWPRKSGIIKEYTEIDKANRFHVEQAKRKIQKGQVGFIDRLLEIKNYVPKRESKQERLDQLGNE